MRAFDDDSLAEEAKLGLRVSNGCGHHGDCVTSRREEITERMDKL